MGKSRYMPFNYGEYVASTMHLSNEELGAYFSLLGCYWKRGRPIQESSLRVLFKTNSKERIECLKKNLSDLFSIDEDGAWTPIKIYWPDNNQNKRTACAGWEDLRRAVFKRDDFTCRYCGDIDGPFECDHIHPVCLGGSDDMKNLATACRSCNRSKGSKSLGEWDTWKKLEKFRS